jgi:hypothetical protein
MFYSKLQYERYSCHRLSKSLIEFSSDEYSEFKFGNTMIAKKFSLELYHYFLSVFENKINNKNIRIYSSPYTEIPTSSFFLAKYFSENLNLDKKFCPSSILFGKINRVNTYTIDYGNLNANDRYNLIKNDTYELNELPNFDDLLIFIDDISITGAHQYIVEKLLKSKSLKNDVIFLYFAVLNDPTVCPTIENQLNYSKIKTITDIISLINSDGFSFTTRLIKFILSSNDIDMNFFLNNFSDDEGMLILLEIYTLAISNKYDLIDVYKPNISLLFNTLKTTPYVPK